MSYDIDGDLQAAADAYKKAQSQEAKEKAKLAKTMIDASEHGYGLRRIAALVGKSHEWVRKCMDEVAG